MIPDSAKVPPALLARRVMRAADRAVLSTLHPPEGAPYGSLVLAALDHDAAPLLMISTLAQHTRDIAADPRVALLFDGTGGFAQPLEGPRVTVLGRAERTDEPRHRARFLARHPDAELYAGFADFAVYRVAASRAHLVAGFGAIHWVAAADLLFDAAGHAALIEAEGRIVEHMNQDHAASLDAYAGALLGRSGTGWRMTGIDPEGIDLRLGGAVARLAFDAPVADPQAARTELVRLHGLAHQEGAHQDSAPPGGGAGHG